MGKIGSITNGGAALQAGRYSGSYEGSTLNADDHKQLIAFRLAEWVCFRQQSVELLATVFLWAEVNQLSLTEEETEYALMHWFDFVVSS